MGRPIDEDLVIHIFEGSAELLRRALDSMCIAGAERAKYEWGLELIELGISDIKGLPSAQSEYEELTPEEAASELASECPMSAWYWLDDMVRLKQMGYAICRKR